MKNLEEIKRLKVIYFDFDDILCLIRAFEKAIEQRDEHASKLSPYSWIVEATIKRNNEEVSAILSKER